MKLKILSIAAGALALGLATTADAQVSLSFGVNTCDYPGYYRRCTDYPPPPVVYLGGGYWGDHDRRGDRHDDRRGDRDRGRDNHGHGGDRHH